MLPPLPSILAPAAVGAVVGCRQAFRLRMRRALSWALRLALRLRARRYVVAGHPVALVLAPHPDDDVLGCGGLIAAKRAAGVAVFVAYLTDGGASHPGHPALTPAELVVQRAAEAREALRLLGVDPSAIQFLGFPDGELNRLGSASAAALENALRRLLESLRPDEIFIPFRRDGSSEHEAAFVHFAAALAASGRRPRVYEFPVWSWWNPLLLRRALFTSRRVHRFRFPGLGSVKARAIAAHASQTRAVPPWTQPVLTGEFVEFFLQPEEFFLET